MLHISSYWPSEVHCTRLADPHGTAYFRLLAFRSALHKISNSAPSCIFPLTGLPECIAEDQQLRIALHISAYWPFAVHCRRLAAPHRAAYLRLLAFRREMHKISSSFRGALQKISSSASGCIFPLTGLPERIAEDWQLHIVLHIFAYWASGVHCTSLAAPHRASYLFLPAFWSALHKISSALHKINGSALTCISPLTGLPECIAQDYQIRIELYGYPDIQKSEYPETRISRYPEIRISAEPDIRYLEIRISGNPNIQIFGNPIFRKPGYPDIRESEYPRIRISRYPKIRITGNPDIQIPGNPDSRNHGYPDIR